MNAVCIGMATNSINTIRKSAMIYGLSFVPRKYIAPREIGIKRIDIALEPKEDKARPKTVYASPARKMAPSAALSFRLINRKTKPTKHTKKIMIVDALDIV